MAVAAKAKKAKVKIPDTYTWVGVNRKGKKIEGEMQGGSILEIKGLLRKQGITPSKVKKKPKPLFGESKGKITGKDMATLSRQIATMLLAGVSLIQAIEMLAKSAPTPAMKSLLQDIYAQVASGRNMSEAIREHPDHFDELYCDLVASGEQSGALDIVFDRIATYKEKSEALKSKIKKALFYPIAVLFIAMAVTVIMLVFVIPQFEEIYQSFDAELPGFTQMVINISHGLRDNAAIWVVSIAAIVIGFKMAHKNSEKFRYKVDEMSLKIPAIGAILDKAAVARFSRTLSTTFAAGVPLVEALESAAGASGNLTYKEAILSVSADVQTGSPLAISMASTAKFPDMVLQMVGVGEESGALDDMLAKVASIYEQEVDDAVDGLASIIEPMMMTFIAVLMGGLIIAMYLPVFKLGEIV
ncbi:type II secretion system F family protein [Algicola sagamiensis]|uniref:type II secretion system F family protein n=1 Tax=Algicola sagamiensis TaxID=163869 RepID=UPI00037260B2|nr:type II secretion system F family protein [Algicola sagamiensis]